MKAPFFQTTTPKRIIVAAITATIAMLIAMSFLFYHGHHLASQHTPLINAAMKLKFETTNAHLWLEEIISGDKNESIETVWQHFDNANWYAAAMLEGGINDEGTFPALEDKALKQLIISAQKSLLAFHQIAKIRFNNRHTAIPGSALDQKFDRIFHEFIQKADSVEIAVKAKADTELSRYYYEGGLLLLFSIITSFIVGSYLYKNEKHKHRLLRSLSRTNKEIKAKNSQLNHLANFDFLTQLPNRAWFLEQLKENVNQAKLHDSSFSLLFLDLDHFKAANDKYGHHAGDFILKTVAERIQHCLRDTDIVSRISGDEFIILLKTFCNPEDAVDVTNTISEKLLSAIQEPYLYNNFNLYVTASIGISIYPKDSKDFDSLLRQSDTAMYHAKSTGKNTFKYHDKELEQATAQQNRVLNELRTAIATSSFEIHYQPQWFLKSGKLYGAEALVRMKRADNTLVYPDEFIGIGEKFGLIHLIDFSVFRQALKDMKIWREKGLQFHRISVNISPHTFQRQDFLANVIEILSDEQVTGDQVEFEFIESALVQNNDYTHSTLASLKELGIKISIDDFGTGYSSMAYLKEMDVGTLKVDRSFVVNYQTDPKTAVILSHIVGLGRDLGIDIIAEGIESTDDEAHLKSLGCNIGQGYLLSKPVPTNEFLNKMLEK